MRILAVAFLVAMTVGCAATVPVQQRSASLGETQRRHIYLELRTEDRANTEAEAMYPFDGSKIPMHQLRTYDFETALDRFSNESERRRLMYREELRERFGITEAKLHSIANEGLQKHWPMPDLATIGQK